MIARIHTLEQLEKNKTVFFSLVFLAIGLGFWNCFFDIGLTDEAYSILFGWKLMSLGDKLFLNEIYNAPRHFDLLNYWILRPLIPYSALAIRISSLIVYALILLSFIHLCFRNKTGLTAGLIFLASLLQISHENEWWNYNTWARDMLVLQACCFVLGFRGSSGLPYLGAGLSMGIAAVAYLPLCSIAVLTCGLLFTINDRKWIWYLGGFLSIGTIIEAIHFTDPQTLKHWVESWKIICALPDYSGVTSWVKFQRIVLYVMRTPEVFFLALLWVLNIIFLKNHRIGWILFTLLTGHLLIRYPILSNGHETIRTWTAVCWSASFILLIKGKRNHLYWLVTLPALLSSVVMAMASANGGDSIHWALPSIWIFFGSRMSALKQCTLPKRLRHGLFLLLLLAMGQGASMRIYPLWNEGEQNRVQLTTPPLQSLWVSPRKAQLIRQLAELSKDIEFALAYNFVPGVFYFGKVRSAVPTTVVQYGESLSRRCALLRRMQEDARYPEIIFRTRTHPTQWGKPLTELPSFPATDPLNVFSDCVTKKILADLPEFQAIEVNRHKIRMCLKSICGP